MLGWVGLNLVLFRQVGWFDPDLCSPSWKAGRSEWAVDSGVVGKKKMLDMSQHLGHMLKHLVSVEEVWK